MDDLQFLLEDGTQLKADVDAEVALFAAFQHAESGRLLFAHFCAAADAAKAPLGLPGIRVLSDEGRFVEGVAAH